MPFIKNDPNINRKGRPTFADEDKKLTNREIKQKELLSLLRKIKPHLTDAIMTAATIMKNEQAQHKDQLKAATILLDAYKRLMDDMYDKEASEDGSGAGAEVQPAAHVSFAYRNPDKTGTDN